MCPESSFVFSSSSLNLPRVIILRKFGKCLRVLRYLARCICRNMNTIKNDVEADAVDPAAVFAAAMSLWKELQNVSKKDPQFNLSDAYSGVDEAMRQVMRVATIFETWACSHVAFEEM